MLSLPALSALLAATLSLELVSACGGHDHARRDATHAHVRRDAAASSPAAASGTGKYDIPPLSVINSGLPAGPTPTLTTTYTAGAKPTYSNAPALPAKFVFNAGDWPTLDQIPPTDSDQVKEWLKELDGHDIPNIRPSKDGSCDGDPELAAQAQQNAWWTCGLWTSGNDLFQCPEKNTWGVSFDDGPADYSPKVLQYLSDHDLTATFFVVGSRVVSWPDTLIAEYMAGHEISVHTWSHPPLTSLTNEQIVAELGWTRHAIKTVLGVTPTTMRPPYGDIDNRVRAIANAMGLRPIIWTSGPKGDFDTNDWRVPAGQHTGEEAFQAFESILSQAADMDHGFIVLEHDLFESEVDLSVGYFLDAALTHNPPFKLESIGRCQNIAMNNMYQETADAGSAASNTTTSASSTASTKGASGTGSGTGAPSSTGTSSSSSNSNSSGAATGNNSAAGLHVPGAAVLAVAAAAAVAVFAGSL